MDNWNGGPATNEMQLQYIMAFSRLCIVQLSVKNTSVLLRWEYVHISCYWYSNLIPYIISLSVDYLLKIMIINNYMSYAYYNVYVYDADWKWPDL